MIGLDRPRRGELSIDGQKPRSQPATRLLTASALSHERLTCADTVAEAVTILSTVQGVCLDPGVILKGLLLEGLATRRTNTLTPRESCQVALSLALANTNARVAIFCEPLLALDGTQIARFQQRVSELSRTLCVMCVTTSLHDACQLGGPHARLTAQGFGMIEDANSDARDCRVYLEGRNLRALAAAVSSRLPVTQLRLSCSSLRHDTLEIDGPSSDISANKILGASKQADSSIARVLADARGSAGTQLNHLEFNRRRRRTDRDEADLRRNETSHCVPMAHGWACVSYFDRLRGALR